MAGRLRIPMLLLLARLMTAQEPAEFFESRVRPVLSKNCFACHTNSKLGGLQLDSREHLLQGGASGPAIVPGQPDSSLLIQAVRRTHARFKMPPQGKLADEEIAGLAAWVKMGAVWPAAPTAQQPAGYTITAEQRTFWAFQPVRKPAAPAGIDHFILAKLQSQGLKPVRAADRRALIRRVTFDLTGLPPTPEEIDAFVADHTHDAFTKVVDRLLASPHYGERYARHWLDLARYADGNLGASKDTPYPNAYRYRDWVIRAFNDDMPYDQFVKAQMAADLLPDNKDLLPALGFHALGGKRRRACGRDHARLPGPDRWVRAVPRSQVRSHSHAGLLLAARRVPKQRKRRDPARAGSRGGRLQRQREENRRYEVRSRRVSAQKPTSTSARCWCARRRATWWRRFQDPLRKRIISTRRSSSAGCAT